MTLHRLTSLTLANDIAAPDAKLATASNDSKSEAELVDVADTLKRGTSERMRVIRLPSHRRGRNSSFVERDQESHQRAYESCGVEGSVSRRCCSVCSSHSLSHIHVDTTPSRVFCSVCAFVYTPACITITVTHPRVRFTNITMILTEGPLVAFRTLSSTARMKVFLVSSWLLHTGLLSLLGFFLGR